MRHRSLTAISASVLLALSTLATASSSTAEPSSDRTATHPAGSFALSGADADAFALPGDVRELWSATLPDGRTQTRYQQYVDGASVFGGQLTTLTGASGRTESVIGAYFPGLEASNQRNLGKGQARDIVEKRVGTRGQWSTTLRIDPDTGRQFYQVESIRDASRPVRWVNAGNGKVIKAFDAIAHGEGTGVKGDTKTILTSQDAGTGRFALKSADGRQATYTAANTTKSATLMTDDNDLWDYNLPKMIGDSQAPGVDAQYYANVVDDFYGDVFGRNSIDGQGMKIISIVHWDRNYCNAFWNGSYMTYGDGDGKGCLPLSGGLDVDGHELTHGVTEFTSGLIYENESGALNEAFSDMMGNTIEFYAAKKGLDPAATPDFRIGEDVINASTPATAGFRNMGDPAEFGDPDHLVEKYTGTADSGGVHSNSGIANHAYYLTVKGGQNAGCKATALRPATHTEDCGVRVPALGLDKAAQIYYAGFTSLPEYANFCDARNATVAVAGGKDTKAVAAGWDAVGVHKGCTPGTPPPPPCVGDATASLPIESPHPYGNMGDCTWTYDNGTAGFSFHFTLLDLEKDYDYVYVKDGNGTTLATYTGTANGEFDSPCITTPTGSVQLVSDPAVTAQGFTVSSVNPC
ncbi:M4 family metallopeptidase [Nocardioides mesophilus]|uniref:Neutral metalloproteinase n=1 Tax=Nocardioides mesophilus TaxID=433659 RepID=A0A7G9RCX1_9ACTN|nr:M4 family metallopeptidase [Nocardioides mesophilus]QNN53446.1 M4 family metallopeptidase [Nocardioides mesophilus]